MAEKPYLAAAFLCEKVLEEKDGVLTAIRIVDILHMVVPTVLPAGAIPTIPIVLLLAFKKASQGNEVEKHQVLLQVSSPSGKMVKPEPTLDLIFPAGDAVGANFIVNLSLGVQEFGLFGIDVLVDHERLTHIPFRLLERAQTPPRTLH